MRNKMETAEKNTKFEERSLICLESAQTLTIQNALDSRKALDGIGAMKSYLKELDETFDPSIEAAFKSHKMAVATKKNLAKPIEDAIKIISGKISEWHEEERRAIALENEKRAKLAMEEAEKKRKEEIKELKKEDPKAAKELAKEEILPVPVSLVEAPKMEGASFRKKWNCDVFDKEKCLEFIVKNKTLLNLVDVNKSALEKFISSHDGNFEIPGVKNIKSSILVSR